LSAGKRKGTPFETGIVKVLNDNGYTNAERRALAGAKDKGDIAGISGVVIEAKNQNRITLAEWWTETEAEIKNANAEYGVCWFKRKGKSSPADGYVLMDGNMFLKILKQIVPPENPGQ
jgi:hypothetical protein